MRLTVKNGFLTLLILLYLHPLLGQETETFELYFDLEQDSEYGEVAWIENLWALIQHPVNINDASVSDLLQIPFLPPEIAHRIVKFRKNNDPFLTTEELYQVDGITEELLNAIIPFIYAGPASRNVSVIYRVQIHSEFPRRKGYHVKSYHNPYYFQQRILFNNYRNLKGGIIWEKDPGEDNYFDYGSFYLAYQHPGKKVSVILGDFYKRVGVGLILWTPYGTPPSIHSLPSYRNTQKKFIGNQSTREVGFLRGLATELHPYSWLSLDFFYSSTRFDGNISEGSNSTTSIYFQGLHRTYSEKIKKKNLHSEILGGSIGTSWRFVQLQGTTIIQSYRPRFHSQDARLNYLSVAFHFTQEVFNYSGEFALSAAKFPAIQQHLYFFQSPIKFELIGYYYHPSYFSPLGRGFGSYQQPPENLIGSAMVLRHRPVPYLIIGGYVHIFRTISSVDEDPFTRANYMLEMQFGRKNSFLRLGIKHKVLGSGTGLMNNFHGNIRGVRLEYQHSISEKIAIKNRLQLHWQRPFLPEFDEISISLYQQVSWEFPGWRIIGRWTVFDVPAYDLRIYEYENDLPGNFRSVLLNGRGYKVYLMSRINVSRYMQIDLKYGHRYYPDQSSISSGLNEILHNRAHEVRMSLNWKILP